MRAVAGDGSVAPLVLLHGATSSGSVWDPILPHLEGRWPILAPTLAGHRGGAPLPPGGHGVVSRIVDDMCRQLDDLSVGRAHLVGNSLGGWVALELARRGRALSVLALSPAGAWRSEKDLRRLLGRFRQAALLTRFKKSSEVLANARLRRVLLRVLAEHPERMTPAQVAAAIEDIEGCVVLADLLSGARTNGPIQALPRTDCRIRIVWGLHDRLLPFMRYGAPMLQAVPGAEFAFLDGVGHVPMFDDPLAVANCIRDFVTTEDSFLSP